MKLLVTCVDARRSLQLFDVRIAGNARVSDLLAFALCSPFELAFWVNIALQ